MLEAATVRPTSQPVEGPGLTSGDEVLTSDAPEGMEDNQIETAQDPSDEMNTDDAVAAKEPPSTESSEDSEPRIDQQPTPGAQISRGSQTTSIPGQGKVQSGLEQQTSTTESNQTTSGLEQQTSTTESDQPTSGLEQQTSTTESDQPSLVLDNRDINSKESSTESEANQETLGLQDESQIFSTESGQQTTDLEHQGESQSFSTEPSSEPSQTQSIEEAQDMSMLDILNRGQTVSTESSVDSKEPSGTTELDQQEESQASSIGPGRQTSGVFITEPRHQSGMEEQVEEQSTNESFLNIHLVSTDPSEGFLGKEQNIDLEPTQQTPSGSESTSHISLISEREHSKGNDTQADGQISTNNKGVTSSDPIAAQTEAVPKEFSTETSGISITEQSNILGPQPSVSGQHDIENQIETSGSSNNDGLASESGSNGLSDQIRTSTTQESISQGESSSEVPTEDSTQPDGKESLAIESITGSKTTTDNSDILEITEMDIKNESLSLADIKTEKTEFIESSTNPDIINYVDLKIPLQIEETTWSGIDGNVDTMTQNTVNFIDNAIFNKLPNEDVSQETTSQPQQNNASSEIIPPPTTETITDLNFASPLDIREKGSEEFGITTPSASHFDISDAHQKALDDSLEGVLLAINRNLLNRFDKNDSLILVQPHDLDSAIQQQDNDTLIIIQDIIIDSDGNFNVSLAVNPETNSSEISDEATNNLLGSLQANVIDAIKEAIRTTTRSPLVDTLTVDDPPSMNIGKVDWIEIGDTDNRTGVSFSDSFIMKGHINDRTLLKQNCTDTIIDDNQPAGDADPKTTTARLDESKMSTTASTLVPLSEKEESTTISSTNTATTLFDETSLEAHPIRLDEEGKVIEITSTSATTRSLGDETEARKSIAVTIVTDLANKFDSTSTEMLRDVAHSTESLEKLANDDDQKKHQTSQLNPEVLKDAMRSQSATGEIAKPNSITNEDSVLLNHTEATNVLAVEGSDRTAILSESTTTAGRQDMSAAGQKIQKIPSIKNDENATETPIFADPKDLEDAKIKEVNLEASTIPTEIITASTKADTDNKIFEEEINPRVPEKVRKFLFAFF